MDRDISHYDERFKSRNRDSKIDQRLKTEKERRTLRRRREQMIQQERKRQH